MFVVKKFPHDTWPNVVKAKLVRRPATVNLPSTVSGVLIEGGLIKPWNLVDSPLNSTDPAVEFPLPSIINVPSVFVVIVDIMLSVFGIVCINLRPWIVLLGDWRLINELCTKVSFGVNIKEASGKPREKSLLTLLFIRCIDFFDELNTKSDVVPNVKLFCTSKLLLIATPELNVEPLVTLNWFPILILPVVVIVVNVGSVGKGVFIAWLAVPALWA